MKWCTVTQNRRESIVNVSQCILSPHIVFFFFKKGKNVWDQKKMKFSFSQKAKKNCNLNAKTSDNKRLRVRRVNIREQTVTDFFFLIVFWKTAIFKFRIKWQSWLWLKNTFKLNLFSSALVYMHYDLRTNCLVILSYELSGSELWREAHGVLCFSQYCYKIHISKLYMSWKKNSKLKAEEFTYWFEVKCIMCFP